MPGAAISCDERMFIAVMAGQDACRCTSVCVRANAQQYHDGSHTKPGSSETDRHHKKGSFGTGRRCTKGLAAAVLAPHGPEDRAKMPGPGGRQPGPDQLQPTWDVGFLQKGVATEVRSGILVNINFVGTVRPPQCLPTADLMP